MNPQDSAKITSQNISWSKGEVTSELRTAHFGHKGAVIWLTGLSGSGKSTLAVALEKQLFARSVAGFILDGDNLRHGLCSDLGFSLEDRTENMRRASEVARLLAQAGLVVVTALISPLRTERGLARKIVTSGGIAFAEVYVNAPLAVCESRDVKGLYAKARKGEIKGFTGIDSPYEPPLEPELQLNTSELEVSQSVDLLLSLALKVSQKS